jgi:SagB-type dehydrogenase family enzyme
LGYLDWASQPNPFRSFAGAPVFPLSPQPDAARPTHVGDLLRHALGLSAWKQFAASRWALRVNPSSGNLHPTEAYVVCGPLAGLAETPAVYHYSPDRHALEQRCAFASADWTEASSADASLWLIALTSIHWREAWKYGERAFRYCQHDLGHAIAALRIAASLAGWQARILPEWSHDGIAALTGVDRDEDYVDAEREDPGCVLALSPHPSGPQPPVPPPPLVRDPSSYGGPVRSAAGAKAGSPRPSLLTDAVRRGVWTGHANQLSEEHVDWTFIDEIAEATRDPGRAVAPLPTIQSIQLPNYPSTRLLDRDLLLRRRSAVALDGRSSIGTAPFFEMLARVMPGDHAPWDVMWWDARIHLVLFVHRVEGLDPGMYVLARHPSAADRLRAACGREFLWERVGDAMPLFALAHGDCRRLAQRLSCDQEIAGDGFFSLGMLADFDRSLEEFGSAFYRHLFWESGVVGQMLYLGAEAAGVRGTGIGCFYDDPVHDMLGLTGHTFQSLYHFTVGIPVEDTRLTTEPGYGWESQSRSEK